MFVLTPAKVGDAVTLMSWMVLTAPAVTVKFVPLKLAIPLAAVVASSMVMVLPEALAFAMLSAPAKPFNEVTPDAGQLPLERQIVPLASGRV